MAKSDSISFLYFDIYSKRISFYHDKKEKIGSYFGLFLTMIYILASIILFIYYFIVTVQRKEMKVYDSTKYAETTPSLDVTPNLIYFAFGIEDYSNSNRFIDETIYYPKVLYINRDKKDGKFITTKNIELPYERCNESNFGEEYQKFFYKGELNTSYCLKNFNITLAGGYKYDRFSYIRLKIFPCSNTTENNNHCKPKEIIDKYISGAYLSLIIKDIGLNPSNFDNPFLPTIQDLYTTIDKKIYRDFILYFGLSEIQSDTGLFNEILHTKKILKFRKQFQSFYFRNEKEIDSDKEFCVIQIRLDDNLELQKRTYTKLPEIFSKIGGYMQLMSTVFSILTLFVNNIGPEIKILNGIFNFNIKKNKMMMKIHSLKDLNLMTFSRRSKPNIISPNKEIINHKKDFKEINFNNKINILINKDKDESILPITVINNIYEETSQNKQLKKKKNPQNNSRISLDINKTKSKNIKNRTLISQFKDSLNESNFEKKELTSPISFNLFDYYCLGKLTSKKKKEIELFNKGSLLYRKRMDIINVFTLLLLTEKKLINNEQKRKLFKEIEYLNSSK